MCDKVELITVFKIDREELPSVSTVMDRFSLMFAARGVATKAWQEHAAYNDNWHWPSMELLLDELSGEDVLYLKDNMSRSFATRHEDTRYILTVTLREYKSVEPIKKGSIMAWLKEFLFGKEIISRKPEDIRHHSDETDDLDKPKFEPAYQRAYFQKLVADWQALNGDSNPHDEEVDAKLVIIGDSGYLLRGAAKQVPDTILWVFLSHMWRDYVFQTSSLSDINEKTLTYSVQLVKARGDDGIYDGPKVPITALKPINNRLMKRELLPHFGGHKEQSTTVELDNTVGPALMNCLGNLFSLGDVLRLNDRGASCVNVLDALEYNVVGGPQTHPGHIFTRLSKIK